MTPIRLRSAVVCLVVVGWLTVACGGDGSALPPPTPAPPSDATAAPTTIETTPGPSMPEAVATVDPNLLLPDLATATPDEIYIENDASGARLLRFSTLVMNTGEGPLELIGEMDESAGHVNVTQVIQQREGPPLERDGGRLVMSAEHAHWHLESFALFQLWAMGEGAEGPPATQNKITFCLLDEVRIQPELPNVSQSPQFLDCEWQSQGISAGWQETYVATLPGQYLDITGLPDGDYVFSTTLDPDGLLHEADTRNNAAVAVLRITGNEVEVIEER